MTALGGRRLRVWSLFLARGGKLALSCKRACGCRAGRPHRLEDIMSKQGLVDVTGRLRSPAATPGPWAGCAPSNRGLRFRADPPTVEEIILVMRAAGTGPYADRTRGLIAILWRAGLRISEASLALSESDLDPKTGAVAGGQQRRRAASFAASVAGRCPAVVCAASAPARARDRDGARRDRAADHPAPTRARPPRDHLDLPPGNRHARDRRCPPVIQRAPACDRTNAGARAGEPRITVRGSRRNLKLPLSSYTGVRRFTTHRVRKQKGSVPDWSSRELCLFVRGGLGECGSLGGDG